MNKSNGWLKGTEYWYYLHPDNGARVKGWLELNGSWYYLNPEDAKMITGWKQIDDTWYFFDESNGIMKTGWLEAGDDWFYFDDDGKMVTDTLTIDDDVYEFDSEGRLIETRHTAAYYVKSLSGEWQRFGGLPYSAKYHYIFTEYYLEVYFEDDYGNYSLNSTTPVSYETTSDGRIKVYRTDSGSYYIQDEKEDDVLWLFSEYNGRLSHSATSSLYRE